MPYDLGPERASDELVLKRCRLFDDHPMKRTPSSSIMNLRHAAVCFRLRALLETLRHDADQVSDEVLPEFVRRHRQHGASKQVSAFRQDGML